MHMRCEPPRREANSGSCWPAHEIAQQYAQCWSIETSYREFKQEPLDSVHAPKARRERAWQRLAEQLPRSVLERNTQTIGPKQAIPLAQRLLEGQVRGRVVADTAA